MATPESLGNSLVREVAEKVADLLPNLRGDVFWYDAEEQTLLKLITLKYPKSIISPDRPLAPSHI